MARSHSFIVPAAEARSLLSGLKSIDRGAVLCSAKVRTSLPVAGSHSLTLLPLPDAASRPSELRSTA